MNLAVSQPFMKPPKRLILLEDDPVDAQLLRRYITMEWPACEFLLINHEAAFQEAIQEGSFDLILSDYSLPGFGGASALALARKFCPGVPFIFVSGAIGDEIAVESLKAGATDYVLKDRPARLVPAIRRALVEAEESAHRRQVEDQLRQSEEQYRDLFENASDLIVSVTPEGRFLFVNRAWLQTLRYSEQELGELTLFDIVHPAYREQCRERLLNTAPRECQSWETIFLTKFGHSLYVEGHLTPRVVSGDLVAARGIFRDVTEKKLTDMALQRSIRQFETLVNSIEGIVWQAELPSFRFTFVSQQAERLLGYPLSSWLEQPQFWKNHIHPEDQARVLSLCTRISAAKHKSFEYRMIANDGRIVWVRDNVTVRSEPGTASQLQGVMVDVTLRKLAEQKARRTQARLRQSNHELLQKNREIQNFYHMLSHELKTPLTSAREFICIVSDGLAGPVTKEQTEFLTIARESCDQLRVCINDLLDATRIETGKLSLTMRPVSLHWLIQRAITTMSSTAVARQIALLQNVEPNLPEIPLDENRINQVLNNLLNNAISHTPPGGRIRISAGQPASRPDLVQLSVSDTGCGIPPQDQGHVFDRLYQVKPGDSTTDQGVGLGLYICRELVELHGGSIWVESEPGHGSTFHFVLPKSDAFASCHLPNTHHFPLAGCSAWPGNQLLHGRPPLN
jgi:PAS domain S-box-containing protein